jgi:uncharacterized protein with NAD-binding domain and iron-sulfur cluster
MFNKRKIFGDRSKGEHGYLSFVISGARNLVDSPNEVLLSQIHGDLRKMIPTARDARVMKSIVLKEKQATMSPDLASHRARPGTVTPLKNLLLAGDWVQTGLPATIESAVISGRRAAAEAIKRISAN